MDILDAVAVLDAVVSDTGAAEVGEVATRAEGRADVASQCADVGALAADHTNLELGEGVVEQLDLVDDEGLSLELEVPSLAG